MVVMQGKAETVEEFLARGGSIKKVAPKEPEPGASEPTVWGKGMSRTINRGGRIVANKDALDALKAAPIADNRKGSGG
jgi:hypothetical protein